MKYNSILCKINLGEGILPGTRTIESLDSRIGLIILEAKYYGINSSNIICKSYQTNDNGINVTKYYPNLEFYDIKYKDKICSIETKLSELEPEIKLKIINRVGEKKEEKTAIFNFYLTRKQEEIINKKKKKKK